MTAPGRPKGESPECAARRHPMTAPATTQCSACGKPVPRGRLMCATHWRQVPLTLQREVWRTWGAFQHRQEPQYALRLLAEYRQAADAATACVRAVSVTTTTTEAQEKSS
jgi:hypothetical protein